MKRIVRLFIITTFTLLALSSCSKDNDVPSSTVNENTLFIYMPWATNLASYFHVNLRDIKSAIAEHGLRSQRVLVYFATSDTQACLYEIKLNRGTVVEDTLKLYKDNSYTTADGISAIFNDMKQAAPATKRYSLVIGSHGTGWLPVHSAAGTRWERSSSAGYAPQWHYELEGPDMTRYYGGGTADCQTDITTLAEAIRKSGLHMEFIMFDDCYMSNIEVAYELRNVTDHLIGCTCEIMAYGMPYAKFGDALFGAPDYEKVCREFYNFYSTYSRPCGTIAVTRMSEIDGIVSIMRRINARDTLKSETRSSIQVLDGYSPVIFYDFGDYVHKFCTDSVLLREFDAQLERLVPYKANTVRFWSNLSKEETVIETFSGLTNSEATAHPKYAVDIRNTGWYKATH